MTKSYKDYFDYWINTSEDVCNCCMNNHYMDCKGEGECPDYYVLTEEDIEKKGFDKNAFGITNFCWDCMNTDNFEFCKRVKGSPCATCFGPEGNYLYFESNGLIK